MKASRSLSLLSLLILFLSHGTHCIASPKTELIKDLIAHEFLDDASKRAITLYHESSNDEEKSECLFLLFQIAKKKNNHDLAKQQREKLLTNFPNSVFAKNLISEESKREEQILIERRIDNSPSEATYEELSLRIVQLENTSIPNLHKAIADNPSLKLVLDSEIVITKRLIDRLKHARLLKTPIHMCEEQITLLQNEITTLAEKKRNNPSLKVLLEMQIATRKMKIAELERILSAKASK